MHFNVITIFEEIFDAISKYGITSKALNNNIYTINTHNPRNFVFDNYKRIDDRPYGGGAGMVMMPQPLYDTLKHINQQNLGKNLVILLSPQGKTFNQTIAKDLLKYDSLTFVCGRYEGIDERFIEKYIDLEISIGDFVVSGGEIPCMAIIDCIVRLLPDVMKQESHEQDSFENNLLDYPHYTKPAIWQDMAVPQVLMNGNHQKIKEWRQQKALEKTKQKRPDLLSKNE